MKEAPKSKRNINSELQKQEHRWRKENNKAITDYNLRIEAKGVFSDGLRRF